MAGTLAGRTIFITGASRGIGEAIALRCAQDGANIVIAAKTAEPHPKLPGTIYSVAKEIENKGGKALPCIVDIQNEDQVNSAFTQAADKFGGIDVLINNASAIHLTGTEITPMKRYDLMNNINTRGTFMCSKYAIPYLKKGTNPHILNISPPLNMKPRWFKDHVAYTIAKYGMSMCALGMSEELKEEGIAVNTLWPRTGIWTAAMAMLGGGDAIKAQCRSVDIMCDAAYAILTRDATTFTGNFVIDDEILKENGVTDFEKYSCVPGSKLLPDFFLDEFDAPGLMEEMESGGAKMRFRGGRDTAGGAGGEAGAGGIQDTFNAIQGMLNPDAVKNMGGIFLFDLKESGAWHMDLKNGSGSAGQGHPSNDPDVTMTLSDADFVQMFAGKLDATSAFMSGKLKIKGNMGLAMKLQKFMKDMPRPAASEGGAGTAGAGRVEATFQQIKAMLNESLVKDINGVFAFDLKDGEKWHLDLKNGAGAAGRGAPPAGEPDVTMTLATEDFNKMFAGKLNATSAFMSGKLKIKGNMGLAMKLEKLMKMLHKSKL